MSAENNHSTFAMLTSPQGASAVLAAVVGVALSIAVCLLAYSLEKRSIRQDFNSLADDRFHASDSMFRESVKLIYFMDNIFLIAPPSNSPGFTDYVRSIHKFLESDFSKNLKLHGLTWAPRVPHGERGDYERTARAVFDPKYQIHAPKDSANKIPDEQQADSFPCYLSLGNTRLAKCLGEDLSLDPEVWKVMQQARDKGEVVATAPMKMSAEDGSQIGYRVFQPLYFGSRDLKTVEERRKACMGFMCLDLDIGVLIDTALKDIQPVGIELSVSDISGADPTVVCRHLSRLQPHTADANAKDKSSELETTAPTELFGRKLMLRCLATETFWANRTIWQPWVLLCGGLALTFTLAGYQLSRALHASTIERVVSSRLAAIQSERNLRG